MLLETLSMQYTYPHTITNGGGEQLTFVRLVKDAAGDYLEVENIVQPMAGPPMHVHFKQEESITIIKGKLAGQLYGQQPTYHEAGDTITFNAGETHKFWNAGTEPMVGRGYIKPAHNIEYFLTSIFDSTKANGGKRPATFDAAYLLNRYKSEFDIVEIPSFVKQFIFPIVLFVGKLQGKHKKYEDAPEPI